MLCIMHIQRMHTVEQIIDKAGGLTKVARDLNVPIATVSSWRLRCQIPVRRVLDVERVTGVPRHEIRPDIYPPPQTTEAA